MPYLYVNKDGRQYVIVFNVEIKIMVDPGPPVTINELIRVSFQQEQEPYFYQILFSFVYFALS